MRDFQSPSRSTAHGINGMVATSHPLATMSALDVLKEGGNAVDAAVTAAAVLGVVEPQSTGIGGDCFALYSPQGITPPIAINGSGYAAAAATVTNLKKLGLKKIDFNSPHSVTVPGAIDTWSRLISDHGTMNFSRILEPAIHFAKDGFPVTPRVALDWSDSKEKLEQCPNASRIFLPYNKTPKPGSIHRQPELAKTLKSIADEGRDIFYNGYIASDIVSFLRAHGSLLEENDFNNFSSKYVDPIKTSYKNFDVFECPPNGQGMIALIMLNIMEKFDMSSLEPNGAQRINLESEATRLAYVERAKYLADPDKSKVPVNEVLSKVYADALRSQITPGNVMHQKIHKPHAPHKDTVYLCVVDRERNAISFINSLFHSFGSGLCTPQTGILLQNRGASFTLDLQHPNHIAPQKRPMHTIIPGLLAENSKAIMPFGIMGGHYQPVGHTNFLINMIEYGMDPQEALEAPRTFLEEDILKVENTIDNKTLNSLSEMGYQIQQSDRPIGGGQAIRINWDQGTLTGGSDPRKDGCALGY